MSNYLPTPTYNYTHSTGTQAGTTVKATPGTLHSLNVNSFTATSVITLFDNTAASGTVIAVIAPSASNPSPYIYDVDFNVGLSFSVATASSDITISWR